MHCTVFCSTLERINTNIIHDVTYTENFGSTPPESSGQKGIDKKAEFKYREIESSTGIQSNTTCSSKYYLMICTECNIFSLPYII